MKALSLWQPWATLLASGAKRIETRSWRPAADGSLRPGQLVAIHAAKRWDAAAQALCRDHALFAQYLAQAEARGLWSVAHPPLGGIVAIARFERSAPTEELLAEGVVGEVERAFGNYQAGRWGWVFSAVRPLAIVPQNGARGLFEWKPLRDEEMLALYLEPSNAAPLAAADAAEQATTPATRVVHCRRNAFDVYIGRAMPRYPDLHAMGWGNPYTAERLPPGYDNAVVAYRDWLESQPQLLARLPELRGKRLGCWCAPLGGLSGNLEGRICHGEVLAALAEGESLSVV